jgi:hypothetical protein
LLQFFACPTNTSGAQDPCLKFSRKRNNAIRVETRFELDGYVVLRPAPVLIDVRHLAGWEIVEQPRLEESSSGTPVLLLSKYAAERAVSNIG